MQTCPTCNGLGTVPLKASYISNWFSPKKHDGKPAEQIIETQTPCPKCKGARQIKAT